MVAEKRYLTEVEVSEMLGISQRTLQLWRLQRRILPFVKLGSSVRYARAEVEKYLEGAAVAVGK